MNTVKNIALVAHDACKQDMVEWVTYNAVVLLQHKLVSTGTTGGLIQSVFDRLHPEAQKKVKRLRSGPLGGDQQMGALIAEEKIDILIFFTDPMSMQPHDVDIKALLRISTIENIIVATTRSTADFVISSPLFNKKYKPIKMDYDAYIKRAV